MDIIQKSKNTKCHDTFVFCVCLLLAEIRTENEDVIDITDAEFRVQMKLMG
jgi:hypothetical protein